MTTSFRPASIPSGINTAAWRVRTGNSRLALRLRPFGGELGFKKQPESLTTAARFTLLVCRACRPRLNRNGPWVLSPFTRVSGCALRVLARPSRVADPVFRIPSYEP